MESHTDRISILIVAPTGKLGAPITKYCLARPNLLVNVLVRDPSKDRALLDQVEKAGGKVIKADFADIGSLKDTTKGIHTVISAFASQDETTFVEGHKALIDDAVRNGVSRFVPSEFGVKYDKFSRDELLRCSFIAFKVKVNDYLQTQPLKLLYVSQGVLTETFFYVQSLNFGYWGNDDHKLELTSYDDTGKVVAAAVANKDRTGRVVAIGDRLTFKEFVITYDKIRGANQAPKRLGSLDDLRNLYEQKRNENDPSADFLGLFTLMYDERSNFGTNDNAEFPDVKLHSLADYLKANPHIRLP